MPFAFERVFLCSVGLTSAPSLAAVACRPLWLDRIGSVRPGTTWCLWNARSCCCFTFYEWRYPLIGPDHIHILWRLIPFALMAYLVKRHAERDGHQSSRSRLPRRFDRTQNSSPKLGTRTLPPLCKEPTDLLPNWRMRVSFVLTFRVVYSLFCKLLFLLQLVILVA